MLEAEVSAEVRYSMFYQLVDFAEEQAAEARVEVVDADELII